MLHLAYWVHNLSPFLGPHWGNIGIRYYGLAYVLGFLAAAWLMHRYARAGRSLLPSEKIADLMMAIVLGVMIGGRVGSFVLYESQRVREDPLVFFRIWEGGMASHGGFMGVAVALAWFARRQKIPFLHIGDLACSTAPIGLMLGRIANFINGELWGKPADVPWAVIFANTGGGMQPRHPSQLYEAVLEGAVLLALMQWRFWKTDVVRTRPGRLAGEFLLAYALLRMIGEIFREPDASLFFGVSRGTFYSIFLIVAGVALILRGRSARR
ncbi:MAG TPA: prolipoprotein diacylglyceryl transferase [Opitutaceae bacterium]|nr:prolipoprotein diacylglyceryl transferase [Opitutaceae bacterium]